jgi:(E)-4-hydroxy-3-methylbut-2-enyl-diphosphate synthase
MDISNTYCENLFQYQKFETREVKVGNIVMGGNNPIIIQSMTTTDTMDTEATVAESIRMIEAGCELIRITAPSKKEAENLANIKASLIEKGFNTPIVADIHFTPNAAEIAAGIVEKVRVNPGNYADKKKFEEISYTDETYVAELDRIRKRFTPLVLLCIKHGTAMRIGTNHGSLSDRILSKYGDTPLGMVESAMEFLRICRDNNYHEIVLSMKASNTLVMVEAYRLLVSTMKKEGMNYPLHLGVTEAGDGEDGRIKSAVGIGALLEDGIGDTIRVSLTEAPEAEAPVAQRLADRYLTRNNHDKIPTQDVSSFKPFEVSKRSSFETKIIGGKITPRVMVSSKGDLKPASLFGCGYQYATKLDKWNITDLAVDFVYTANQLPDFALPGTMSVVCDANVWKSGLERIYPLVDFKEYQKQEWQADYVFVRISDKELFDLDPLVLPEQVILVLRTNNTHAMAALRAAFMRLHTLDISNPVLIERDFEDTPAEETQLYAATDFGGLLIDGYGDGIWLKSKVVGLQQLTAWSFNILQATRSRISKTEYISCPSCGRTLFDLQETTAKIRTETSHLKGLKIGIMGCIVNGPGEMADADYGYVGTGIGKITLYKEKEVVRKNVPSEKAVNELIDLIKQHGDWVEPK